jgi:hypothetical protein
MSDAKQIAKVSSDATTQIALVETVTTPPATVHPQVIYCGPTLPRQYGLSQYHVFHEGLPAHLDEVIVLCPAIKALIVPVDYLATTRIALDVQGSAQAALYQQIVQQFAPQPVKPVNKAVRK